MTDDPMVAPELSASREMATMVSSVAGGAIPVVGGALAELANRCLKSNHEAAMGDFFQEVAMRINRLNDDTALRQRLAEPEFTETLTRAARAAEATSQHEKRVWLANAVVNCLRADAADNLERLRNLRLIDQLMPVHIHVLRFLMAPEAWLAQWGTHLPADPDSTHEAALAHAIPWLPSEDYAASILTDLQEMELISRTASTNYAAILEGIKPEPYTPPIVCPRAASLLRFIAEPPDGN